MSEERPLNVNDPDHVDEVMEELWEIRRKMWAEVNGDIRAMGRYLEEQRRLHPEWVYVSSPPDPKTNDSASEPDAA